MRKELYIGYTSVSQDQIFRKTFETLTQLFLLYFIFALYLVGIRFSLLLSDLVSKINIENKLYVLSIHDAQTELEQHNSYQPACT